MKIELNEEEVIELVKNALGWLIPKGHEIVNISGKTYSSDLTINCEKRKSNSENELDDSRTLIDSGQVDYQGIAETAMKAELTKAGINV